MKCILNFSALVMYSSLALLLIWLPSWYGYHQCTIGLSLDSVVSKSVTDCVWALQLLALGLKLYYTTYILHALYCTVLVTSSIVLLWDLYQISDSFIFLPSPAVHCASARSDVHMFILSWTSDWVREVHGSLQCNRDLLQCMDQVLPLIVWTKRL